MVAWLAISSLVCFWCLVHTSFKRLLRRRNHALLPGSLSHSPNKAVLSISHHTQATLSTACLSISTTKYNNPHDTLTLYLNARENKRLRNFLVRCYDFGVLLSAVGMFVAVAGLLWFTAIAMHTTWQHLSARKTVLADPNNSLVKRNLILPTTSTYHQSNLIPIIPGWTVPLSHAPAIIFAIFATQAFHELGHAISAALELLPLLSCGLSFIVCIPTAFVALSESAIQRATPRSRARVLAAGCFHNFILWTVFSLVSQIGMVATFGSLVGYEEISNIGKGVINVDPESPLFTHISPNSVITKLDDISLATDVASKDIWYSHLHDPPALQKGWCVEKTFLDSPTACCHTQTATRHCFQEMDGAQQACVEPVSLLANSTRERCWLEAPCPKDAFCMIPSVPKLLRISVKSEPVDQIVLWMGPSEEVLEQVHVGNWVSRKRWLPIWLPATLSTWWQYLTLVTTSLFFFNLLPVRHLDGGNLFEALLSLSLPGSHSALNDIDLESRHGKIDEGVRRRRRWKEFMIRFVPKVVFVAVGFLASFTIINLVF